MWMGSDPSESLEDWFWNWWWNWQVISLSLETILIGGVGDPEGLAIGRGVGELSSYALGLVVSSSVLQLALFLYDNAMAGFPAVHPGTVVVHFGDLADNWDWFVSGKLGGARGGHESEEKLST